ncbi:MULTISPECIES: hypothetical protein [Gluconobacter]|uniref:hypothetical protein n=1 Tax=Gluconobacter TaxID=441 RepID=UPI0039E772F3
MLIKIDFVSPDRTVGCEKVFIFNEEKPATMSIEEALKLCKDNLSVKRKSLFFDKALETISYRDLKLVWSIAAEIYARQTVFSGSFRTEWTTRSHLIRDAFDDDNGLTAVLWQVLPPYRGQDLIIWRGEQARRFEDGRIGLNWSTDRDQAEIFARGLCTSYPGGGTLLKAEICAEDIISGFGTHAMDRREKGIVVDPTRVRKIESVSYYP